MTDIVDEPATNETAAPSRVEAAREKLTGAADAARNATADAYAAAREKVGTAYEGAKDRIGTAYEGARERTENVIGTARERAGELGRKTADSIQDNPLAALVGGLAAGALVAALLPRTEREAAAIGALGAKLGDAARGAADAAKQAGREKLDELGLTPARAQESVSKLFADVAKAATHAGSAAAASVRTKSDA